MTHQCLRLSSALALTGLVAIGCAGDASAEVRWTYENGVLTEIASPTSGSTLWAFNLTNAGALSKKTYGNGSCLDFRATAMPEGAPAVVTVSANTFASGTGGNATLKELHLGEQTVSLPSTALMNFTALTNCTFGPAFTTLGYRSFKQCTALTEVVLPPLVTTIGDQQFYGCTALKRVVLPDNLRSIEAGAFSYCSSLTNVTPFLPRTVTTLGASAFEACHALRGEFEYGFATNAVGEPVAVSLPSPNDVLIECYHVSAVRLGPGFSSYPWRLTLYNTDLTYVEMGENISVCYEQFNQKDKNPPITNVVIKYTGTFVFPHTTAIPGCSTARAGTIPVLPISRQFAR